MILKSRVGNIPRILSTAAALENVGAHAHRFYYQFVHILCWKALPRGRPHFPQHARGKYTASFVHATNFTFLAGPGRGGTTDLAWEKDAVYLEPRWREKRRKTSCFMGIGHRLVKNMRRF